jgi:hypothetical protein
MPGLLRACSILSYVLYPMKPARSLHKKHHMGRLRTATDSRGRLARSGTRLVTRRQASAGRGLYSEPPESRMVLSDGGGGVGAG